MCGACQYVCPVCHVWNKVILVDPQTQFSMSPFFPFFCWFFQPASILTVTSVLVGSWKYSSSFFPSFSLPLPNLCCPLNTKGSSSYVLVVGVGSCKLDMVVEDDLVRFKMWWVLNLNWCHLFYSAVLLVYNWYLYHLNYCMLKILCGVILPFFSKEEKHHWSWLHVSF